MTVCAYLRAWIDQPATYNYRRAALSVALQAAVDEGLLARSPMSDVRLRPTRKREANIPDDVFLRVTGEMAREHEVYARACDLLYLVSHRPADVLALRADQVTDATYSVTGQLATLGRLESTATKNDRPMIIEYTDEPGDIGEIIKWMRAYKRSAGLVSPYLVVHPPTSDRRLRGRPITREHLYRRWADGLVAVGYKVTGHTLRDLRPRGLTDEAKLAGGEPTNKGGHKTES